MNEPTATRYQRQRRRAQAAGVVCGFVVLSAVAVTPAASWLAGAARTAANSLPATLGPVAELTVFVSTLVALWELAALPAVLYLALRVDATYAREPAVAPGAVLAGQLQAVLIVLPAVWLAAGVVRLAMLLAGVWWWVPAGLLLSCGMVAAMRSAPGLLAGLAGSRPVARAELRARIAALATRARVPVTEVLQLPADLRGRTTALVAGLGRSRRVFVSSDVVRDWTDDEIAVVVAHELGHHAHNDLWRAVALDGAVLCAGLGASARAVQMLTVFGLPDVVELAAMPLIAALTGAVWILATPVRHAQSRRHERRADAFALALTGSVEAFDAAIRRLGARHLAEERPGTVTRWLFLRHPSVDERLEYARVYRSHVA